LLVALEEHGHDLEGEAADEELAVVMLLGDKTALGNLWYPTRVNEIETQLKPGWEAANPGHHARIRRTR